jgi:hypothetical protein
MIPIAATVTNPTPTTPSLVATPLPESFAARVPYTDISPSVSSVQINNNARGNGSYIAIDTVPQYAVPVAEGDAADGAIGGVASSKIPATFLAQIIGQGVPPAMQGALSNVLAAYDQLVFNSFVKYRPSNATLPPPAPASVFGKILAQEQGLPEPVRIETPPVQTAPPERVQQPAAQNIPVQPVQAAAPEIKQAAPAEKPAPQPAPVKRAGPSSVKVAIAYLMAEARVDMEAPPAFKAST